MRFRINVLYTATLAVAFVLFLAKFVDLSSEVLAGLAGGVIALLATIVKELVTADNPPSLASQILSDNKSTSDCPRCKDRDTDISDHLPG